MNTSENPNGLSDMTVLAMVDEITDQVGMKVPEDKMHVYLIKSRCVAFNALLDNKYSVSKATEILLNWVNDLEVSDES